MKEFQTHEGIVVPIDQINVDTDAIMPKDFIKRVERTGFGQYLFYHWRYNSDGSKNNFVLNQPEFEQGSVLIARKNFGCGSSREHAPWGLQDYGFKTLIAPSFGDIFYTNCLKIGLLPAIVDEEAIQILFDTVNKQPGKKVRVDLQQKQIYLDEISIDFKIDDYSQYLLLAGLDDIELTNQHEVAIQALEQKHRVYYKFEY